MTSRALALVALLPWVARGQTVTRGVQCSCDPPGTYRPPGYDCASHCAPRSAPSPGGGPGLSFEQQVVGTMFGSLLQGMMQPAPSGPSAAQRAAQAQYEAELRQRQIRQRYAEEDRRRRNKERERFEQGKTEAQAQLKGDAAPASFELKDGDEEPKPSAADKPKGPSVLDEALKLLRKAEAADREAAQALAEE